MRSSIPPPRPNPALWASKNPQRAGNGLLHHVGQQADEARALDGLGQFALLLGGHRRDAGRHDLAALGNEALQQLDVLIVDLRRALARERAGLAAAEEGTARSGRAGRLADAFGTGSAARDALFGLH